MIAGSSCLKIRPFVRLYSTKQGMAELGICMTQSAHGGDHSVSLHFLQAPSCIAGCRRIRRDTSGCIRSTGTPSTRSRSDTTFRYGILRYGMTVGFGTWQPSLTCRTWQARCSAAPVTCTKVRPSAYHSKQCHRCEQDTNAKLRDQSVSKGLTLQPCTVSRGICRCGVVPNLGVLQLHAAPSWIRRYRTSVGN